MTDLLQVAREVAMAYLGTPYIWGGDDPSGFDCSGFCIEILQSVGLFPRGADETASMLYDRYPQAQKGLLGCLVFYMAKTSSNIIHVEFCLGGGLSIGASGGGSSTTTIEKAMEQNAFIKIRPYDSRPRRAGFRDPFAEWR